jgi:hypothetical protein
VFKSCVFTYWINTHDPIGLVESPPGRINVVVYYESIRRDLKTKPIYECRCDERPKHKTEESTLLGWTGVHDKTN